MSRLKKEFPWAFIETHVFLASAMEADSYFIEEILSTGIEIRLYIGFDQNYIERQKMNSKIIFWQGHQGRHDAWTPAP